MADYGRGCCAVCWLVPSDRAWLERLTAEHGRLPKHVLRKLGITKWCWWRHKHGRCRGQLPYFTQPEWDRRRFNCVERLRPWRWRPGFCPNPAGRPRGAKGKRPRAKAGSGVVEAIRTRRGERGALASDADCGSHRRVTGWKPSTLPSSKTPWMSQGANFARCICRVGGRRLRNH